MSTEVTPPVLGESVTEGTISRWPKATGETVEVDEPLLKAFTDKADIGIPPPVVGTLLEIRFDEDDTTETGAILVVIGEASEASVLRAASTPQPAIEAAPVPAPAPAPVAPPVPAILQAVPADNATEVAPPVLGELATEGIVSRWLKAVGGTAEVDELPLEISTDKVSIETPSPIAGTLLEICVAKDETAATGTVLVLVDDAAVAPLAPIPAAPPAPTTAIPVATPTVPTASIMARRASVDKGIHITPLVRELAVGHSTSLSSVQGTGVGGRVHKQDILDIAEAAKKAASALASTTTVVTSAPATVAPQAAAVLEEVTRLCGTTKKLPWMRKIIVERMTESLRVTSQLTATVEVDVTVISGPRRTAKDEFKKREGTPLSYLPFIMKTTTKALKAIPVLSASTGFEADTVAYTSQESIGVVVDTNCGLMVPAIQDTRNLNLAGLAKYTDDLTARTRAGKVGPDEPSGGTFTITNHGLAGILFDAPITNLPQAVVLGAGALVKWPMVVTSTLSGDTIVIRDVTYLSLTYDHRPIDGAEVARFLSPIKAHLEAGDFVSNLGF